MYVQLTHLSLLWRKNSPYSFDKDIYEWFSSPYEMLESLKLPHAYSGELQETPSVDFQFLELMNPYH